jgi:hypothetical protein
MKSDTSGRAPPETVDFGYERVAAAEKGARVRGVFDSVAGKYDLMNDLVLASAGGLRGGVNLARAAKAAVILLAVFMGLEQLDIAQDIVLVFFIAVVGAAALAAGIAFGLGGRDIAAQISREWYERTRAEQRRYDNIEARRTQHGSTEIVRPPEEPRD